MSAAGCQCPGTGPLRHAWCNGYPCPCSSHYEPPATTAQIAAMILGEKRWENAR